MTYAHQRKPIVALPGTRMPQLEQATVKTPWTGSTTKSDGGIFDRVFGAFGGG